jgi:hypothetical protein
MSWGQWMIVEWTLEEELHLEAQARSVLYHHDEAQVRELCASLVKQHAYYCKLMQQATGHIAEIELGALLGCEHQPEATESAIMALTYPSARDTKPLGNLLLRLLRAVKAMVRRDNMPIDII